MSELSVEECRARGITLPSDALAAQAIVDEEEAWLTRRIGLLTGSRAETFYVGLAQHRGKLALSRYTDDIDLLDGGIAVQAGHFRLVDRGSAVHHTYSAASQWWTGPYVVATYTPNDEDEVRKALFALVTLAAQPAGAYASETIGAYSYSGGGQGPLAAQRAIVASGLLPKHDPLVTISSARRVGYGDPVINRAEAQV